MADQKAPNDGKREPQDVNEAELDEVAGGRGAPKPLNPQPLPPISL